MIVRPLCALLRWQRPTGGRPARECRELREGLAACGALVRPDPRQGRAILVYPVVRDATRRER